MKITFEADLETGEADMAKALRAEIKALPPLLAADILLDVLGIANALYADAAKRMREEWQSNRVKLTGQDT